MPTAKKTSSARSLAPPFQTATAGAGLRFGFLNAHGHLFCQHNPRGRKACFATTSFYACGKKTSSARSLAPSFQLQPAPLGSQLVCRPVGGFSRKRKDINFNRLFVTPPYIEENLPFACKRIILLISPHGGYEEVEDIWRTITTHKKLSTVCHEQSDIWKRSAGWWKKDGIAAKF